MTFLIRELVYIRVLVLSLGIMKPVGKIERALGMNLGLKPHRCNSPKCPYVRRQSRPGAHGSSRRMPSRSVYGRELMEKQRIRFAYGMDERMLRRFVREVKKVGGPGEGELIVMLERRIDNVVARGGLASSRREARILIRHGHFALNAKPVRSPSILLSPGDVVTLRPASQALNLFQERIGALNPEGLPSWLSWDPTSLSLKVERLPGEDEVSSTPFNTQLVVEYYSR